MCTHHYLPIPHFFPKHTHLNLLELEVFRVVVFNGFKRRVRSKAWQVDRLSNVFEGRVVQEFATVRIHQFGVVQSREFGEF